MDVPLCEYACEPLSWNSEQKRRCTVRKCTVFLLSGSSSGTSNLKNSKMTHRRRHSDKYVPSVLRVASAEALGVALVLAAQQEG